MERCRVSNKQDEKKCSPVTAEVQHLKSRKHRDTEKRPITTEMFPGDNKKNGCKLTVCLMVSLFYHSLHESLNFATNTSQPSAASVFSDQSKCFLSLLKCVCATRSSQDHYTQPTAEHVMSLLSLFNMHFNIC